MLNDKDYQQRVAAGKSTEKEILDLLRARGMKIADPTSHEDMVDKIDGWLEKDGKKLAVQVKFREGGDDVIFEILKDIDKGIPGRDMISKASLYIVKDRQGVIRMFSVGEIKRMADVLLKHVIADLKQSPQKTDWGGGQGAIANVKLTVDKAHGNRKLMAFFNPKRLTTLGEWQ
jgi:hypothetical protein